MTGPPDTQSAETRLRPKTRGRAGALRARVRSTRAGRIVWRIAVTTLGILVIAVGILLLPLPGPGWLIIFAGLGLLGTEYAWAARLLARTRSMVRGGSQWLASQPGWIRAMAAFAGLAFLAAVALGGWWLSRKV